jgi:hypothetical protein
VKFLMRFAVCLAGLSGCVWMTSIITGVRPVHLSAESCGSGHAEHLTRAQAFPLLPTEQEWIAMATRNEYDDDHLYFTFNPPMPMCRYDEERGCWILMETETHPCTDKDPKLPPEK